MISSQRTLATALLIAASSVCAGAQPQNASEKGAGEKPKVVVDSGDTVSIETLRHSMDEIKPGASMEEIVKLRLANPGGGPHSVTGPVYVNGAEPGDTMEIRIKKIVMK